MSLTAEALKQLGSEAAGGVAQEKKDWDAVSASAYEALGGVSKSAITEVKNFPNPPQGVKDRARMFSRRWQSASLPSRTLTLRETAQGVYLGLLAPPAARLACCSSPHRQDTLASRATLAERLGEGLVTRTLKGCSLAVVIREPTGDKARGCHRGD